MALARIVPTRKHYKAYTIVLDVFPKLVTNQRIRPRWREAVGPYHLKCRRVEAKSRQMNPENARDHLTCDELWKNPPLINC
jgi:hypothetical protein